MIQGAHAEIIDADVVIVGGGPAGCSAALALKGSGKKVLLVDKAVFPREKTCGDSIPAYALIGLENISPGIYDSFLQKVQSVSFRSSALVFPNASQIEFTWPLPGYVTERQIFDAFLLDRVIEMTDTQVITGLKVVNYQRVEAFIRLNTQTRDGTLGAEIITPLVIAADGAPSLAARRLAGISPDPVVYGQAVRCYFEGVEGIDPRLELIFYHPRFFPGYFWMFPMTGGRVNAGFGMPEKHRRKTGASLVDLFQQFREQHPVARRMLENACQVSEIRGGIVPFAMKKQVWSGPGFMLTGDAGSLVDPVSGDGIMYAVRSGLLAGLAAKIGRESLYGKQVEKLLWNRMKSQRRAIRLMTCFPFLISVAAWFGRFAWFRTGIHRWIW
ncbi:MAG: geranylgeranyl reductase family protein [Porphyromonadaceae bacterium]|nr:MAG: geranylgeranyl reductase family protein [Porphyromonadaceae bacterium]